jgi:UMF1 family MFS transporter
MDLCIPSLLSFPFSAPRFLLPIMVGRVHFKERTNSFWNGDPSTKPEIRGRTTSSINQFTTTQFIGWMMWGFSMVPLAVCSMLSVGPYITYLAKLNSDENNHTSLWGLTRVPYDSYWPYLTTISIIFMATSVFIGGPLADVSPNRKQWLIYTSAIGGCLLPLLIILFPSSGKLWHFIPVVYLPSTALTNLSGVIWASYMIDMIPESQRAKKIATSFALSAFGFVVFGAIAVYIEAQYDVCGEDSLSKLSNSTLNFNSTDCVDGVLREGVPNPQMESIVTITMPLACVWGLVCLAVVAHLLPNLPASREPKHGTLLKEATMNIKDTVRKVREFPQFTKYMANEMIVAISDTTIATLFSVVATDKLGMKSADVAAVLSTSVVFVVSFNMIAGVIIERKIVQPKTLILIGRLGVVCNILFFAFSVDTVGEFWLAGIIFGIANGIMGVTATQLFSMIIPPVYKSEFFALRSVNASLLSWMGPLLFGVINQVVGFTAACASLAIYVIVGTMFLMSVDVETGVRAALNFEEEDRAAMELTDARVQRDVVPVV